MKVAIVRGTYTTKFEIANYEPLFKKHKIDVFTGLRPIHKDFKFPLIKSFSPVDLPDFPYKMAILNRLFLGDAMWLFGLEKKLKSYDVVHVRETYFNFTQQALNAKKKGWVKKVVCTCSETIPFNHEGIWNRKKFKKRAILEIDKFHCHTDKAKKCLIKEGCNPDKISVFAYGLDLKQFRPIKDKSKKDNCLQILYVGRLVKEKGLEDLIKAFNKLKVKNYKVKLTIIGSGEEEKNIKRLVNELSLEKFVKIKQVLYKNIVYEYQKADIFCLLSKPTKYWQEYSSRALTEAIACGLPSVVSNNGGNSSFAGQSGLVVEPGDWKGAYLALEKLLNSKSLRLKLSTLARNRAIKLFNIEKVAKKIENLWV
ncbi:glycosyltransferase family 4 protein [Patescibacteria group bacterium]